MAIDSICSICFEELKQDNVGALLCGHTYCYTCINEWMKKITGNFACPICRSIISSTTVIKLYFQGDETKVKKNCMVTKESLKLPINNCKLVRNKIKNEKSVIEEDEERDNPFIWTNNDSGSTRKRLLPRRSCTRR